MEFHWETSLSWLFPGGATLSSRLAMILLEGEAPAEPHFYGSPGGSPSIGGGGIRRA
jgi:hypothetical protein